VNAPWRTFTHEQSRAALLVDRPMLAAAGAGAGKTAVMAVRYCACLLDRERGEPLGPERVLALAFTREAAGNLRARVDRTLRQALALGAFPRLGEEGIAEAPLRPDELAHLRACLERLGAAPITTFDGWCLQAVVEHAAELGRDPELAPPDPLAWERCRDQAWQTLRRDELASGREALPRLCEAYGERAVCGAIMALGGQASALPEARLRAIPGDPLASLLEARAPQLTSLREAVAEAREAAQGVDGKTAAKVLAVASAPADAGFAALREWLESLDGLSATHRALKEPIQRIQDLIDFPNARAADLARPSASARVTRGSLVGLTAWRPEFEALLAERAAELSELAHRWLDALDQAAERAGVAGFARLEAETLRLLGQPRARASLGRRYRHVLLDEAQDLNRLQGRIIELLQEGGAESGGARVFTVGDHRQSIFGFRHAAPRIFQGWEEAIVGQGGGAAELAENFRSHPGLLQEILQVFAQPALNDAFSPGSIRPGRAADGRPALLQRWAVTPHDAAGPVAARAGSLIASEAQARVVARTVAESVAAGRAPGDHAVLLRSRSRMRVYASALEALGVPYDTDFPGGLFDSQECHDVEAILRLCLCPHDRFALAVAFGGPWGGSDPQDRRAMVEALELPPAGSWRRAGEGTALHGIVAAARARLDTEGPAAAVRLLLHDPALAARYGRLPLARRRLANLVALAEEADAESLDGAAFVARLLERRRLGVDAAEASGEEVGGRGVRLMTIHGAKGLEWPVVLLPDLDRRFELRDLRALALALPGEDGLEICCRAEPDAGIGLRAALTQDALYRRALEEEARLFYVACTRATHELHCLVGAGVPDGPAPDGAVACPGGWLAGAAGEWSEEVVRLDERPEPVAPPVARPAPLPELLADPAAEPAVVAVTRAIEHEAAESAPDLAAALNRDLGIALHAALARFGPGMSEAQARAALAPFRGQVEEARLDRLARRLGDRGLVPGYWEAAVRLVEQPVIADGEDGAVLLGVCDLLLQDERGRWWLYDYKSGAGAGTQGAGQLRAYAGMLAPHLGGPLEGAWIVDLEHGRLEAVALDA
jgi:ATP-dependent helicase/nuclease subunit A